MHTKCSVGKPEGKRPLGRHGLNGGIILEMILGKWDGGTWNELIWFKIGAGGSQL
jgi:hypothetical protein